MKIIPIFLLAILATGCATSSINTDLDAENRIKVANQEFKTNFQFYYVQSQGSISDATFISLSSTAGPSGMAKQLASIIQNRKPENYKIAISGPNNTKTAIVIQNAMKILENENLSGIELMYLGNETNQEKVRNAVELTGATFIFKEYKLITSGS